MDVRDSLKRCKRVLVKVGTGVVTNEQGFVSVGRIGNMVERLGELYRAGVEVLLVSSGAVGIGRRKLATQSLLSASIRSHMNAGHSSQDEFHITSRAAAAAGQSNLMALYETLFGQYDIKCSQLLVTDEDFQFPHKRGAFRETCEILLKVGVIPIINENDVRRTSAAADADSVIFWDNDSLACHVGAELEVDLIMLLSDVDGVYKDMSVRVPSVIPFFNIHASSFNVASKSSCGRGGIEAKVAAALSAVQAGVSAVVIASGFKPRTIARIVNGEVVGTLFNSKSLEKLAEVKGDPAREMAMDARQAVRALGKEDPQVRVEILMEIANRIDDSGFRYQLKLANDIDLAAALANGISEALIGRLGLSEGKLNALSTGLRMLAQQKDPVGKTLRHMELSSGLILTQETRPLGVLAIVFESRPDVLPQIAALAIRSGNAILAKGGKEAFQTNSVLHGMICGAIHKVTQGRVSGALVGFVRSRKDFSRLLSSDDLIDLVIPRGSGELVSFIQQSTKIPVMGHAEGICHVYVDEEADIHKAKCIVVDAKTDYPTGCNAVETILVHDSLAASGGLVQIIEALQVAGVTVLAGPELLKVFPVLEPVPSFRTEYSELKVSMELVSCVDDAITHIHRYGSGHTECIVTESDELAQQFLSEVDSACVFHNASTRFADGFRFGLGAEVGISTGRIHARGPVGVDGLLTTAWKLDSSDYHTVGQFSNGDAVYTHKSLPLTVE